MSWSCSTVIPSGTSEAEMRDLLAAMKPVGNDDAPDERQQALETAAGRAAEIILSGSCGDLERGAMRVTLVGHANPVDSGRINDRITVDVAQVEG